VNIRKWLTVVFHLCNHEEMLRVRDPRGRYFVKCSQCGMEKELIKRYPRVVTK
jgi:hypothetical protein